jgi:hypothetical protein
MIYRALLITSAWLMVSGTALAAGMDCPTLDYDKVESLLTDAPSCDASMQLLLACQRGASGDVGSAMIAIKKCEADFLPSLGKSRRRAYDRRVGACWNEFANDSGTLYQSIRAICAADVAHTYAGRAAKRKAR